MTFYETFKFDLMTSGTCQILNGGCGELCVPEENGRRCECDIGLQLQPDQSCDSGGYPFIKPNVGLSRLHNATLW